MEQCPVQIEHVPLIVEMRRNLVLEQSKFPQELVTLFNNLERNGNPYSFPASTRADWAAAAGVQELAQVEDPSQPRGHLLGGLHVVVRRAQPARRHGADQESSRPPTCKFAILGKEEALQRRSGPPRRQRVPVSRSWPRPISNASTSTAPQTHRRQLSALLQHAQERVPAARRQLRRHPPQPVHPGADRRRVG